MKSRHEWAIHIIERFGESDALDFATDNLYTCPCISNCRQCNTCEYFYEEINREGWLASGCKESHDWHDLEPATQICIKKIIMNEIIG